MKRFLVPMILGCSVLLSGCGGSDDSANDDTLDGLGGCDGYVLDGYINVKVHDSIDDSLPITDATVLLISSSDSASTQDYASYIADEDGDDRTETGAYFSTLSLLESEFTIDIEVSAPGYNSAVAKNISFKYQDDSCGADDTNSITYDVYMCPTNSNCL